MANDSRRGLELQPLSIYRIGQEHQLISMRNLCSPLVPLCV